MTTNELSGEESGALADERHASEAIANRLEQLVSMGAPSCDVCYSLDSEDRPKDGGFWPNPLTMFVNVEGESLSEWMDKTVCDYHNPAIGDGDGDGVAVEATHRVRAHTEYADDHNHKGARRYNVQSVTEVEE